MITITIETQNDAFAPDPGPEIARILRHLADRIEHADMEAMADIVPRDINGNRCGHITAAADD